MNEVCVEFLYRDNDIMRYDENDRRLFLNREFSPVSGRHVEEDLNCKDFNSLSHREIKIIDNLVYGKSDKNIALSKNDFADYLINEHPNFIDIDFSGFKPLFERFLMIISNFDSENN